MAKKLVGIDVGSYVFNATAKTVTFSGLTGLTLKQILSIVNVTKEVLIYIPVSIGKGGSLVGNVLTLNYDTTTMSNSNELQVYIDYGKEEVLAFISSPQVPPSKTPVDNIYLSNVSGGSSITNAYIIPNGVTLVVTYFECGAEGYDRNSRITLYYSPSGVIDVNSIVLSRKYLHNHSDQTSFSNKSYTGNGTRALIVERSRLDGNAKELYARWEGYY